jgi:hypothetical protein
MAFDAVGDVAQDARLVPYGPAHSFEVCIRAIDSFVRDGARQPDLVKIDVEGHENETIRGMAGILRTTRPVVVCEVHQARHENEHDVQRILRDLGYLCSWLEPGMHRRATWWAPHVVGRPAGSKSKQMTARRRS